MIQNVCSERQGRQSNDYIIYCNASVLNVMKDSQICQGTRLLKRRYKERKNMKDKLRIKN